MVDVFAYEIVEALERRGCPLCRALEQSEAFEMASFLREGRRAPEARLRFYSGGGFCRRHGWLFHTLAVKEGTGAPVADIYGSLLNQDLASIRRLEADLPRPRARRHRLVTRLRRAGSCPACDWAGAALDRKTAFLVEAMSSDAVRSKYEASDGLCYPHFVAALERALNGYPQIAGFLVRDWRGRLERLARDLAEYDRKRDYRYAEEPRGAEQQSWTDVIRRYVGEPFSGHPLR